MKFSYQWLKDLGHFAFSPNQIAELLTLHLAESRVVKSGKFAVLEVDLLPNRVADAGCHLGLTRELLAYEGKKFVYPRIKVKESPEAIDKYLALNHQSNLCNYYSARLIQGVQVKKSPLWLQQRLKDCGLRSINNVVDASNYIMLLTGQPLHVFDYDKLSPILSDSPKREIIIRLAHPHEAITTLDGEILELSTSDLVIADHEQPVALAGIKGGRAAEITQQTQNIVLESANFDGVTVRKTSRLYQLITEASWRFEHNLSPQLAPYSLELLAQLIREVSGGEILAGVLESKKRFSKKNQKNIIPISWSRWSNFLGWSLSQSRIKQILTNLGFSFIERKNYLLITPPEFRNDIICAQDVMGEVARLIGINNIPLNAPLLTSVLPKENEFWVFKEQFKDWLAAYRLEEVYNYSLISKEVIESVGLNNNSRVIKLANPLSNLFYYLRPSLIFNFLENVQHNLSFRNEVRLFELGKIYQQGTDFSEDEVVGGVLSQRQAVSEDLFLEAKGILEDLLKKFGFSRSDYSFTSLNDDVWYSSLLKSGAILMINSKPVGVVGISNSTLNNFFDLKNDVVFWEIKLASWFTEIKAEKYYKPLPKYPAVSRDISFIISSDILIDIILNAMQSASPELLVDVDLFDVYRDEQRGNKQSLSFHLVFQSPHKTLTKSEVDQELDKIITKLKHLGAIIR